jgi:hypothetical protein
MSILAVRPIQPPIQGVSVTLSPAKKWLSTADHLSVSMSRLRTVKLYLHSSWHSVQAQGQFSIMIDGF